MRPQLGRPLPELLAPAGNREALLGALNAGADAVYLGGTRFGARAYAENFTQEGIVQALRDAHLLGRKIYLTANTLLRDDELEETVSFVSELYEEGLDGVIVQDLGLIRRLHEACPGLLLHASTQLSVTLPEGVELLRELGCCRVVPARELSLKEIQQLKDRTGIEVEAFIHGAMCYSYSGRCLFSSFLGGRSGNRGRCAGTCRLPFRILDEAGRPVGRDSARRELYPLSMRDLCTLEILPALIDVGIDSFKIEGRMKKPEYAAGVTAIYRKYLQKFLEWDANGREKPWEVEREDLIKLHALYLRTDLSTGYYYRKNGRELLTINSPGYEGTDDRLLEEIRGRYLRGLTKREIEGEAEFICGQPASLRVRTQQGYEASAEGPVVERSRKRPLSEEELRDRLGRTGDSPFAFSSLSVHADKDIFLPVSAVNALRREALAELEKCILADFYPEREINRKAQAGKPVQDNEAADPASGTKGTSCVLWADVCSEEQTKAALRAGAAHLILEEPGLFAHVRAENGKFPACYLAFPHIFRERERKKNLELLRFAQEHCEGVLVRTAEELQFVRASGYQGTILSDSSLYAWNSESMDFLTGKGCRTVLPLELSFRELSRLCRQAGSGAKPLLMAYGRAPLMITAGCIRETEGACALKAGKKTSAQPQGFWMLEDRKRKLFPVRWRCASCGNVIYNSLPTSLHKYLQEEEKGPSANLMLVFTTECGEETERIIKWFEKREGQPPFSAFTNGHAGRSAL